MSETALTAIIGESVRENLNSSVAAWKRLIAAHKARYPNGRIVGLNDDGDYINTEEYVAKLGKGYGPAELTRAELLLLRKAVAAARRAGCQFQIKQCFYNSQMLIGGNPQIQYVEGYVMKEPLPIAIHHAWNTLNGKVIDLTMRHPIGEGRADFYGCRVIGTWTDRRGYLGVEIPREEVRAHVENDSDILHGLGTSVICTVERLGSGRK